MLYNRAAADPDGKPWSERKRLTWWDEAQARWQSYDSVDFEPDKRPDYRPAWRKKPVGLAALRGAEPFIMMPDGRGAIFSPTRLMAGPLPTHSSPVISDNRRVGKKGGR